MKRSSIFLCCLITLSLTSCKTQEDIRRERTVEKMNEDIQATKSTAISSNSRFQTLEEQVQRMTGLVEEANHSKSQVQEENKNLSSRLQLLEDSHKKQVEYLKALTEKVNNQSDYIAEVIETLKKMSVDNSAAKKKLETKKEEAPKALEATFKNGYNLYQAKDYAQAKVILSDVANNKKASRTNRDGALHHLGLISYKEKNYKDAQVYFSRLYSESQNSKYAAASLLELGKTFSKLNQNEESKMTFEELLQRFPTAKEATEAKKLLK